MKKTIERTYLDLALFRDIEDSRDKLVLLVLSINCDRGHVRSKYEPLAEQCSMTKASFSRSLGRLRRMDLVTTRKIHNEDGLLDHYLFNIKL